MSTEARPFLKWAGGKGQLLDQLSAFLPKRIFQEPFTYIEPFVGGGAMLFYMLRTFNNLQRVVINDVNEQLITAYRTVKDHVEPLISLLQSMEGEYLSQDEDNRKQMFLSVRDRYNNEHHNSINKTAQLLFLNRTCFNGLYRVNSRGHFNVPFGRYKNPMICNADLLRADSLILQRSNIEIVCGEYADTRKFIHPNVLTFLYFDPPYRPLSETSSFTSYAKNDFNDDDQRNLAQFCQSISGDNCYWMLSNADCSAKNPADTFFEELYKAFTIERVQASRSINANPDKRGKLTELLIHNDYEI